MTNQADIQEKIRVLPVDIRMPEYSLGRSIKYLLFAFSAVNAFYFALGSGLFNSFNINTFMLNWFAVVSIQWMICLFRVIKRT